MQSFTLPFEPRPLVGDTLSAPGAQRQLLLLHGAGRSQRSNWRPLRDALATRGVTSTAFDFIGHGDTGGELAGSSLAQRVAQAGAVLAATRSALPLALLGSSMGAYVAIRLLAQTDVRQLVLVVPGVYTPDAYTLPFGPAFSAAIRQPDSWRASDAWARLAAWPGELLVVAATDDAVIPAEIPQRLIDSARRARRRELVWLAGQGHLLAAHWATDPAAQARFHRLIGDWLTG